MNINGNPPGKSPKNPGPHNSRPNPSKNDLKFTDYHKLKRLKSLLSTRQHYYESESTTITSQEVPKKINKQIPSYKTLAEIANLVIGESSNTTEIIEKDAKTVLTYLKNEKLITNFMKDAPNFSIQQHTWHLDESKCNQFIAVLSYFLTNFLPF